MPHAVGKIHDARDARRNQAPTQAWSSLSQRSGQPGAHAVPGGAGRSPRLDRSPRGGPHLLNGCEQAGHLVHLPGRLTKCKQNWSRADSTRHTPSMPRHHARLRNMLLTCREPIESGLTTRHHDLRLPNLRNPLPRRAMVPRLQPTLHPRRPRRTLPPLRRARCDIGPNRHPRNQHDPLT
jgi:hypothetical protein